MLLRYYMIFLRYYMMFRRYYMTTSECDVKRRSGCIDCSVRKTFISQSLSEGFCFLEL